MYGVFIRGAWQHYWAESLLGESLAGEKQLATAKPLLHEGYEGMRARSIEMAAPDQFRMALAQKWLANAGR